MVSSVILRNFSVVDGPPEFFSNSEIPSSEKTEDRMNKQCDDRGRYDEKIIKEVDKEYL